MLWLNSQLKSLKSHFISAIIQSHRSQMFSRFNQHCVSYCSLNLSTAHVVETQKLLKLHPHQIKYNCPQFGSLLCESVYLTLNTHWWDSFVFQLFREFHVWLVASVPCGIHPVPAAVTLWTISIDYLHRKRSCADVVSISLKPKRRLINSRTHSR